MRNPLAHIKTIVLFSAIAFAGHVLATPDPWFSGTAEGEVLTASAATWDTNVVGEVTVAADVLSIDLPTNTVVKLTPTPDSREGKSEKKTYVVVDGAVFTPTFVDDIDYTVVQDAQTALTVAYDNTPATNYYAYIGGTWKKLAGATPGEEAVDVTIELDYSKPAETNASFKVGSTTLYDSETDVTSFPISGAQRCLSRIDLAGYGSIHSITTTVESAVNVSITPTSVTYGADFTNVTIVATVSGDGYDQAEYTLNWNGSPVQATVTPGEGIITITAPIAAPLSGTERASATYTISVVNGEGSSGEQTTMIADNRDWVTENSTHTGSTGTGSWSNTVNYVDTVATVEDNTYTASSCSTGDLVTITFENLRYAEFSDLSVGTPDGTQGAFALAETKDGNDQVVSTNFYVLVMEGGYTWKAATCTVPAAANVDYTVVMTFDYVSKTYSVKVSDGTNEGNLTVSGESQFNLCDTKSSVTDFVFKGSGKMSGIKGVDSTCFMAKDGLGNWYTTIAAALATDGKEFIILRDTGVEAPSGWEYEKEGDITKLIKKVAKGLFFMAY